MKTLFLVLFVTTIAGVEFYHELSSGDFPGAVCLAPESQRVAINDLLVQHLRSH